MKAPAVRIGVVLSSGGTRGVYAHTGFLQALANWNIPVSAMAGCSAGAIVGGVVASGTPLSRWSEALANVKRSDFWNPDSLWRFLWKMTVKKGRGYTGLSRTEEAIEFCRRNLLATRMEDCRYPFYTIAVSLSRSEKVIFSRGELAPRMVASAAMPLLYRPVAIDGDWYCDGALIDIAPSDAICCRHDLDVLIVHHVSRRTDKRGMEEAFQRPWSMLEVLDRLIYRQKTWYMTDEPLKFFHCPCGCGAAVVVLTPRLPELAWPLTEGGDRVLEAARRESEIYLRPYMRRLLSRPKVRSETGPSRVPQDERSATSCRECDR